ncbi:MAG: C1 family peptidase, partial [Candidatus Bathyarchaeia archaeon]
MQLDLDNIEYKRFIIPYAMISILLISISFSVVYGSDDSASTTIEGEYGLGWLREDISERDSPIIVRDPLPDYLDWRDVGGIDWTTAIRNQGGCGSCVAFSAIGTFEANLQIDANDPDWDIDLSEQLLFSCGGGDCTIGWYISSALNYLKDYGTAAESYFPYQASDLSCPDSSGWPKYTIASWNWVTNNVTAIQTYLQDGPVVAAMDVYDDFFSYSGGIYQHTSGGYAGGHAITIVGYNNTEGYWIAKNSWDTWWGENGWFKIAFGECNIETSVAAMTVSASVLEYLIQFDSSENNGGSSNQGTITFESSTYSLPDELNQTSGNYQVTFNPSVNYCFVRWVTSGGIAASNPRAQSTTVTITGSATLTAIYKLRVSIYDIDCDIVNASEDNVNFIYPDYTGSKPPGVSYAALSDWTAAGYIAGMCTNIQKETTDTNQLIVDSNNGTVILQNETVILFGGPIVNAPVKYYENNRVAPLYYRNVDGANYWYEFDGTRLEETRMTYAEINA